MPTPAKCLLTSIIIAFVMGLFLEVRDNYDDTPGMLATAAFGMAMISLPIELVWWIWC